MHLGHLPLAELTQRGGQQGGDLGAEPGGDLGRSGQQEVAGHDGHQVPEPGVDALDIAADGRLVHDVVVVERGQVDQFDRHRPEEVLTGGSGRTRKWRWPGQGPVGGVFRRRPADGS